MKIKYNFLSPLLMAILTICCLWIVTDVAYGVRMWELGVDAWIGDFGEISVRDWIIRHGILDMVLIFLTEYLTGSLLRRFGICPWDYTGRMLQINGVIRLDFAPFWFGTGLLFEYLTGRKTKSPLP